MTEKEESTTPAPTEETPAPSEGDEGKVEKESEESFPASDPPSW